MLTKLAISDRNQICSILFAAVSQKSKKKEYLSINGLLSAQKRVKEQILKIRKSVAQNVGLFLQFSVHEKTK